MRGMQSPFVTIFMYLNESEDKIIKNDLALIIEEVLKQRILGVKNEKGIYVTPAFPKIIYVLEEDNIKEDSKYWYLTELAAKCTAKRLVPDYISEKIMKQLKSGHCFPVMGCHEINTPIIMFDGTKKMVQDIVVGDVIMGDDGTPRNVLELVRGKGIMYRINQSQAEPYVVNEDHILSLVYRSSRRQRGLTDGDKVEISVKDFIKLPKYFQSCLKGYKGIVKLPEKNFLIPPYILGLWLGDGHSRSGFFEVNEKEMEIADSIHQYAESIGMTTSKTYYPQKHTYTIRIINKDSTGENKFNEALRKLNLINNKHIPEEYLLGSEEQRSDLLAGLINTDGWGRRGRNRCSVCFGNTNIDLIYKAKEIADSLGYRTNIIHARKEGIYICGSDNRECYCQDYYHLSIRGFTNDLLMEHKRPGEKGKRDFDTSCLTIEKVSDNDNYYGFNLDGNQLYLFNDCTVTHNCRSALSVWKENPNKFYGRWNKGVVTINLPYIACDSEGENYDKNLSSFWKKFDEELELCHRALLCRYERLKGTVSDVAPILWQHGAISRLKPGETIDSMLTGGYSTISLGYAGLWECVYELCGKKLTQQEGKELGLKIMEYMNQKCDEWNKQLDLGYSIYGTPIESTTYKFAKSLQKRFGVIPGVTDKNYITNSYHVKVTEPINAFDKLLLESEFQKLSTGGAISYIEVPNLQNNIPAVLEVIKFIYDNIMYAELNTKSDYCQVCGFDGEIVIKENENKKLVWTCPNCGNNDHNKMNVARRVCGYISTNDMNQGRIQEIKERVLHL